ncbi:hypothetical protein FA13DRAFT_1735475 [Coprinellus micaceus]|uniref:DUF6533 domain-containing protein n=1 Tax=Coprinellus micaceus TaxID=71717 RepID=A0A4Y7T3W6_COPMI|nr:hypothetical protein FA13DRAFT_1735475 [Coprinellus micaceus]
MSTTEQIAPLANQLFAWRAQEYIAISFYSLYVHYIATTLEEETRAIYPQRWGRGKLLYITVRYGIVGYIALSLTINYPNHYDLSPVSCKGLHVAYHALFSVVFLACNFALGLCICALLQARTLYFSLVMIPSVSLPLISAIFVVVPSIQYPPIPRAPLDEVLGYPCRYIPSHQWSSFTIAGVGENARNYVNLGIGIFLPATAAITFVVKYGSHSNRIIKILGRDGGLYSVALLGLNLCNAIIKTPGFLSSTDLDNSPAYVLIGVSTDILMPICIQRLMLSVRTIDHRGSETLASTLLFTPISHESNLPE